MNELISYCGNRLLVLAAFVFASVSFGLAADSGKTAGAPASVEIISQDEYISLRRSAEQARLALASLQPIKGVLVGKIEKLKSDYRTSPSDVTQTLMETYQSKLDKVKTQERQLKQALVSVEKRLADLRSDPEQAASFELFDLAERTKAENEQQKAVLRKLQGISRER